MTEFLIYDVFTDRRFGGNPLAIHPDASEIPEDQLQKVAREFNFSETTFVYPPKDPAHTARVRIFTPTAELPFAGHPTIGTAVALSALGKGSELVLELRVGPIPVSVDGASARFVTKTPLHRGEQLSVGDVAACLSLQADQVATQAHAPMMAGLGLSFCFAELADDAAVSAASPDLAAFRSAAERFQERVDFGLFCYARNGDQLFARMFAPTAGIPEDPATGSASAAISALLADTEGQSLQLEITQGTDMGRPSKIITEAIYDNGHVTEVSVAGQAVKFAEGRLTL